MPVALIAVGLIWLLATGRTRNGTRLVDRITGALSGSLGRGPNPLRTQSAPGGAAHAFESPIAATPAAGAGAPAMAI
jgi:hypothetical protein